MEPPAGFSHWPHIRKLARTEADAVIAAAQSAANKKADGGVAPSVSTYELAAEYAGILIGSSKTYHYFLVNLPKGTPSIPGTFVCDDYDDLPSNIRATILEARFEAEETVDGEAVESVKQVKIRDLPADVTALETDLIPAWIAGMPRPGQ